MNKYSILVSLITLILGFSYYGEYFNFNIKDTYYVIAAEVFFFGVWLIFMIIFWLFRLKIYLAKK